MKRLTWPCISEKSPRYPFGRRRYSAFVSGALYVLVCICWIYCVSLPPHTWSGLHVHPYRRDIYIAKPVVAFAVCTVYCAAPRDEITFWVKASQPACVYLFLRPSGRTTAMCTSPWQTECAEWTAYKRLATQSSYIRPISESVMGSIFG